MWLKRINKSWKNGFTKITGVVFLLFLTGCNSRIVEEKQTQTEYTVETLFKEVDKSVTEKGYNLPVEEKEKNEAKQDCIKVMELYEDIYKEADKGDTSNVVLDDEIILEIQKKIKKTGCPVTTRLLYSDMDNYKKMEQFIKACKDGKSVSVISYEVYYDGGIGRNQYTFDGKDMYLISTTALWNEDNHPVVTYIAKNRINKWRYTDKGWFAYEICVPQPPEVSEIVDGCSLVRVRPMKEKYRRLSEKYVRKIGYIGNNLLDSNWDLDHMNQLDYNGLFEYFYLMKFKKQINTDAYQNGIPKKEFENLIMEYLPVTAGKIRQCAAFHDETQTYDWEELKCSNYDPKVFHCSIPEVVGVRENGDDTITLTVDAVCEMNLCDDAVITSELTIRARKDGSFQYLGNQILEDGIHRIPTYQYRIKTNQ